jgi:hypothetical protein
VSYNQDDYASKKARDSEESLSLSAPSAPQQPLTEANLRRLDSLSTPSEGFTSPVQTKTSTSVADRDLISNSDHIMSGSTPSSTLSTSKMRTVMKANNLLIGEVDALTRYPEVLFRAKSIINGHRSSGMKPESQAKIITARNRFQMKNEDTFVERLWKLLLREERERNQGDSNDSWALEPWDKDFLDYNLNKDFRTGSVPIRNAKDPVSMQLLESLPRLKTPKPDMAYGLANLAFTKQEQELNECYSSVTELSESLFHTFFIVECKSHRGTLEEAETQASGGGAALVCANRRFNAIAGPNPSQGADLNSFVFSLAMTPSVAKLYVHWAGTVEIEEKGSTDGLDTMYHMHRVAAYILDEEDHLKKLRHDIDNILDWGTLERKTDIKARLADIQVITQKKPTSSSPSPLAQRARLNQQPW